jgi:hypothetical protein
LAAANLDPGVQRSLAIVVDYHASLRSTLTAYSQRSCGPIVIVEVKGG